MSTSTSRSPSPEQRVAGDEQLIELFLAGTAEFAFHRRRLQFDLARTVFASAAVDPGSALLLRHLQTVGLHGTERVLDVGCGHGTLGVVLRALDPTRPVTFVDRDALALALTRRNLAANDPTTQPEPTGGAPVHVLGSLGYDALDADERFDLVVSNIPGKVGAPVIADLIRGAARVGAEGATAGFVIVAPLADELDALLDDPQFEPVLAKGNRAHAVRIVRIVGAGPSGERGGRDRERSGPQGGEQSGFDRGIYDRARGQAFAASKLSWRADTVHGLHEFDTLTPSTALLRSVLHGVPASAVLVVEPGQGHVAAVASLAGYRPEAIVSRDLLALRATERLLTTIDGGREGAPPALVHAVGPSSALLAACPVTILAAPPKVHGPWYIACVERWLRAGGEDAGRDRSGRRHLVLAARAGLLGRLEADMLTGGSVRIDAKRSSRGFRVLRISTR